MKTRRCSVSSQAAATLFVATVLDNNRARSRPSPTKRYFGVRAGAIQFDLTRSLSHIDLASPNRTRYESPSSRAHLSVPARLPRALACAAAAAEICIYSSHARDHVTLFGHVIDERVARAIKRFVSAGCRRNRSNRHRVAFRRQ